MFRSYMQKNMAEKGIYDSFIFTWYARLQVIRAVAQKIAVKGAATQCSFVHTSRPIGGSLSPPSVWKNDNEKTEEVYSLENLQIYTRFYLSRRL